jgi:hypothetical protein
MYNVQESMLSAPPFHSGGCASSGLAFQMPVKSRFYTCSRFGQALSTSLISG